jgi:hypothetical protein
MKMITAFFLAFLVALIGFPSVSNAAAVGDQLTAPEAGWERYDDSHSHIVRKGTWSNVKGAAYFGGSTYYSSTAGDTIIFSFKGTKLRIIAQTAGTYPNNVPVLIDGVPETFSINSASTNNFIMVYEKLGLEDKPHEVVITVPAGEKNIHIDAIDIDESGYLINSILSESVLTATVETTNINLKWTTDLGATGYNVKRAITSDGPFETIATSVIGSTYSDVSVIPGITYYYVVTAKNAVGESAPSNVVSATIPITDDGRAILVVTLTTGLEKEYDLSMQEVNAFIDWYEAKQAGSGTASYAIDKHDNNKGPFKSRKDYILFDRILTFEVSEY